MTNSINKNTPKLHYPFSLSDIVCAMDQLPDGYNINKGNVRATCQRNGNKYYDGKISQSVYNHFAEKAGVKKTDEKYVSTELMHEILKIFGEEAPEIIINYLITYYDYPPEKIEKAVQDFIQQLKQSNPAKRSGHLRIPKDQVLAEDKTSLLKMLGYCSNGTAPIIPGMYGQVGYDNEKSRQDINVGQLLRKPDDFISKNNVATIQETIRSMGDGARLIFPLSSRLLKLSVTPSEMTVGRHKGYTVLSPEQSRQKLDSLGMRENDRTPFMSHVPHLTSDKMGYKTVLFDKNSDESKAMKNDTDLIQHVTEWLNHHKLKNKYYTGVLDDKLDSKLAINQCMYTGMRYTENANSYTVTGYLEDVYDFCEKNDGYGNYGGAAGELNHIGVLAQKKGAIQPYRVLIPFEVTIPKSAVK